MGKEKVSISKNGLTVNTIINGEKVEWNDVVTYEFISEKAQNKIERFIEKEFGGEDGMVGHEIASEYVHTDVAVNDRDGIRSFVTFGAGARAMNTPIPEFEHAEYIMLASSDGEGSDEDAMILCGELQRIGKYPFQNDTWLGPYHTLNASDRFCERFGFEFILFSPSPYQVKLRNQYTKEQIEVNFLIGVPVYEDERNWMAANSDGSRRFLLEYLKFLDGEPFGLVNRARDHIIPEE